MKKNIRNTIAGTLLAAGLGTQAMVTPAQADIFNLDIHAISANTAPATDGGYTIPAHASVDFHFTGIDTSLNSINLSDTVYLGNAFAVIQTTTGPVNTPDFSFSLYAGVNGNVSWLSLEDNSPNWRGISVDAHMPVGFAFNSLSDYTQYFAKLNEVGVMPGDLGYPTPNIAAIPQTFSMSVPEPSSLAMLGVGTALALGRRRTPIKSTGIKQSAMLIEQ